jgi:hypothetical protein
VARFVVGERSFPSKKALLDLLRTLRDDTPNGQCLKGEDKALFLALLKWRGRVSEGVAHITTQFNGRKHSHFLVVTDDGEEHVVSYRNLVSGSQESLHKKYVNSALRNEIYYQIAAVRDAAQHSQCPVSGRTLRKVEVDHVTPYAFVRDQFLAEIGQTLPDILYIEQSSRHWLRDRALADRWRLFHATHAKLVAVDQDAHRQKKIYFEWPEGQTYQSSGLRCPDSLPRHLYLPY